MKKQTRTIAFLLCCGVFSTASAEDFDDYARVTNAIPRVEQVNQPQQECHTEYVQTPQRQQRSVGGAILGGIAGGVLGNQVGGGSGRNAATAVGAITGAIVGDRMENNDANATTTEQPVRQCRTVEHWETRTNGYNVTYEYHGHTYTTVMPYNPGKRVKVRVAVTPM